MYLKKGKWKTSSYFDEEDDVCMSGHYWLRSKPVKMAEKTLNKKEQWWKVNEY